MFNPAGLVSISLGSVVLDRPDRTGMFFAKDSAGGWAYLVGDADGDNRWRGQGVCEGGLDLTLRCGFMLAVNRVPECRQIRILVETRRAHQMMVHLAVNDPHIFAAIAGRPVSVLTRPEARSSYQVRNAAERVAAAALREREHAERHETGIEAPPASDLIAVAKIPDLASAKADIVPNWRTRLAVDRPRTPAGAPIVRGRFAQAEPPVAASSSAVRWLVDPIMNGARNGMIAAGMLAPPRAPRSRAMNDWLSDLDSRVALVAVDLQDVGA